MIVHEILNYFETGNGYQFWSGIGSCAAYVTGPLALSTTYIHHHMCHAPGCHSIHTAIHPDHGWRACKRHYDADPPHLR